MGFGWGVTLEEEETMEGDLFVITLSEMVQPAWNRESPSVGFVPLGVVRHPRGLVNIVPPFLSACSFGVVPVWEIQSLLV